MVLILVLMEDTLRVYRLTYLAYIIDCLNPCFNGRYSQRVSYLDEKQLKASLNPCFNGRYSQRETELNYNIIENQS